MLIKFHWSLQHLFCNKCIAADFQYVVSMKTYECRTKLCLLLKSDMAKACDPPAAFEGFNHVLSLPSPLLTTRSLLKTVLHQVELVVNAGEDLRNGCWVRDHTAGTRDLGQISSRNHLGISSELPFRPLETENYAIYPLLSYCPFFWTFGRQLENQKIPFRRKATVGGW